MMDAKELNRSLAVKQAAVSQQSVLDRKLSDNQVKWLRSFMPLLGLP